MGLQTPGRQALSPASRSGLRHRKAARAWHQRNCASFLRPLRLSNQPAKPTAHPSIRAPPHRHLGICRHPVQAWHITTATPPLTYITADPSPALLELPSTPPWKEKAQPHNICPPFSSYDPSSPALLAPPACPPRRPRPRASLTTTLSVRCLSRHSSATSDQPTNNTCTPIAVFSKSYCPYCRATKSLLSELGAKYYAIELDQVGS